MAINLNYLKTRVVRYPLLALAVLATIIATGLRFDLSKNDWSGWVQAVGSIGAILASGYIATWQYRKAAIDSAEQRRQEHLVQVVAIHALMREVSFEGVRSIATIENMLYGDNSTIWQSYNYLVTIEESFRKIPLWQLPNPQIVSDISALFRFIPRHRERLTELYNEVHSPHSDLQVLLFNLSSMRTEFGIWEDRFARHVLALGGAVNAESSDSQ